MKLENAAQIVYGPINGHKPPAVERRPGIGAPFATWRPSCAETRGAVYYFRGALET